MKEIILKGVKARKKSIEDFLKAWNIYKNKEKFYKVLDKEKELIFKKDPNTKTILKKLSNKIE